MQSDEAREIFKAAADFLKAGGAPSLQYEEFVNALKPKVKAKGKNLFMPLRMALTGKEHGPELKKIFPVLGIERVKKRFERALRAK